MTKQFSHLMSPGYIGNVEIKNRIWSCPMMTDFAGLDGSVTPRMVSFYVEKAKGGAGMINVEAGYIDRIVSKAQVHQFGLYSSDLQTGMAQLTMAMHDWGAKCSTQICHVGLQIVAGYDSWSAAPSDMVDEPYEGFSVPLRGLTREEIKQLIQDMAMAAWRVKLTGFDMVEVHAANGHLLGMFLSPYYNKRTDEYGGSLEKRMRIVLEIIENIKMMCGPDYPVIARLATTDYRKVEAITVEDTMIMAKMLEEAGVLAIDLSAGDNASVSWMMPPAYRPLGTQVAAADAIKNKSGIKIPVIVSGSITTPNLAEEILSQGKADFIGIGRPNVADPYWGKKIEAGVPEDIVPCIRCALCLGDMNHIMAQEGLRCAVNPRCGFEDLRKVAPLEKKKKVVVIGGGPGGMEAARLATLRGHDVTLYEKRKLGGALHEAGWDREFKPDIGFLLDYYKTQMKKLKIKVVKEKASADTIVKGGYDVAIVATGAGGEKYPQVKKVPGYNKPHVYTDRHVTSGKDKELGKTVIVVGGGTIATEIAVSQAMKGKKVIMTAPESSEFEIAADASLPAKMCLMEMLKTYNVQMNLGLFLKEVTDDGVISVDQEGKTHKFKGDSVVICAGFLPDLTLAKALKGKVKEVRAIGDCVKPRLIGDAIREGWLAANQI